MEAARYYSEKKNLLTDCISKYKRKTVFLFRIRVFALLAIMCFIILITFFSFAIPVTFWIFSAIIILFSLVMDSYYRSSINKVQIPLNFYTSGLDRLNGKWRGKGVTTPMDERNHPYANDILISGEGSLMDLIFHGKTQQGINTLYKWLSNSTSGEEILSRQTSVRELMKTELMDKIVSEGDIKKTDHTSLSLNSFFSADAVFSYNTMLYLRISSILVSVSLMISFLMWLSGVTGYFPMIVTGILTLVIHVFTMSDVSRITGNLRKVSSESDSLLKIARIINHYEFESEILIGIKSALSDDQYSAEKTIKKLKFLTALAESSLNQIWAFIAFITFWNLHISISTEIFRKKYSSHTANWGKQIGIFESLFSLSVFAMENPEYTFPEVSDKDIFLMEDGFNPLHPDTWIRNTVNLGNKYRFMIVSGSNMSGKSSLLRTCSLNYALANAGSIVSSSKMVFKPGKMVCSIRIIDSTRDGISRFYAEVLKIKTLVNSVNRGGFTLFFIDELFSGTNSEDRLSGADKLLLKLQNGNVCGILTTHDLAITAIGDDPVRETANFHFRDQVKDNHLHFDYQLQSGKITSSNALYILEKEGII
ncbi:MAG: hypothetical protein JXR95_01635 [Deltaproteobacteria bacterium]|nr:hypothetical protein [Deltaproteobacteria bacterium]